MTSPNGARLCPTILPVEASSTVDPDIGTPFDPAAVIGDDIWATMFHGFPLPGPLRPVEPAKDNENYIVPSVTDPSKTAKYPRATTVAETLDAGELLVKWQLRQAIKGVHAHPSLMAGMNPDDSTYPGKMRINEVAEKAMTAAGANRASEFGTAVHAWIAAVEVGQVTVEQVPDMFRGHVRAYFSTLAAENIRVVPDLIERQVYTAITRTVGTFDRIIELPDGTLVIADIKTKTSRALRYGWLSIGIQLDIYSRASAILAEDCSRWERPPVVSQDIAAVIHVPSDAPTPRCEIKWVDLNNGRRGTDLAVSVIAARAAAEEHIPMQGFHPATRR